MEVHDTDDQVIEQTSIMASQWHITHRRTKMAVMIDENAFAGNLSTTSPAHGHCTARRTNMTAINRNLVTLGVFVGIVGTALAPAYGQACKTNIANEDPATRHVCATWDAGGDPTVGTDFTVDYTCTGCADAPRVEFITGGTGAIIIEWVIYSEKLDSHGDPTGLADLGDVLMADDVVPNDGKFKIKIQKGTAAGVDDLKSLVLDSTDASWTGHSSISAGTEIDGVINGAVEVIDRSGSGGEIAGLTVNGPPLAGVAVVGPIDARRVTGTNLINGAVTNKITMAILDGVSLTIEGAISNGLEVTTKVDEALLVVKGTVPVNKVVTIADMIGQSGSNASLRFGGLFAGKLTLTSGIDNAHAVVGLTGDFTGTIDLTNSDIAGQLIITKASSTAEVKNGRSILNGAIFYPSQIDVDPPNSFDGLATFLSVASGGEIESINGAEIGGTIRVTGDMAGEVAIVSGSLKSGGLIDIGGDMTGEVHIALDCVGDIDIGGDCTGDIVLDEDLSGDVDIVGGMTGDLDLTGDMTGSVTVRGALANGSLIAGGRIMVGGESSGPIKVGKQTGTLTLIQVVGGLGTGGKIEINTTQGAFDAEGDILIGVDPPAALPFDGCIRIHDQLVSSNNGNLEGDIDVIGCHDPAGETLVICIDGDVNGNVTLDQTDCSGTPATWGCDDPPNCP